MVEQVGQDGFLTGTMTIVTEGQDTFTLSEERYVKGSDLLSMSYIEMEGEKFLLMGIAVYQGQIWGSSILTPWSPVDSYKEDISALPTDDAGLEKADVSVTQGVLDGVPMTKMTVVWDSKDFDPEQGGEGKTTVTYWLNQTGQMVRYEIDGEGTEDGVKTTIHGVFNWQPWDKPIPWPAEIVGQ